MTLRLQLILTSLLFYVVLFFGISAVSVGSLRHFLDNQLESHAQDTATSLGLALSSAANQNDLVTMGRMVDAIFDRGYYTEITVSGVDGKVLIERKSAVKVEGIPEWLIELFPLSPPREEAIVTSGWKQFGKVYVRSHPGFAYSELWESTTHELAWFLAAWAATLMLGFIALHFMLRSLHAVESQANAIIANKYPLQEKLPWTRDLRQVVGAMNKMSAKVAQMFKEQASLTEMLRAEAYMDTVTNLGNMRWFRAQVESLAESPEGFHGGALFFLALDDFKAYNEKYGLVFGDAKLNSIAGFLHTLSDGVGRCLLAHSSGANFALLCPGISADDAQEIAQKIIDGIRYLHQNESVHIGIACIKQGQKAAELFAEADMALRVAQNEAPSGYKLMQGAAVKAERQRGADYWRQLFACAIENRAISLQCQPVVLRSGALYHNEVLLRISDEQGEIFNAGVFMPMAESLGFSADFDKLVIAQVRQKMNLMPGRFALNISVQSLLEPSFMGWLEREVGNMNRAASRLVFELPENEVVRHVEVVRGFIDRIKPLGCEFGIDHCGGGFASFGYLASLEISYLKIDGIYSRKIDAQRSNQFLVQSMAKVAHELDILIIAQSVETETERDTLLKLYIDGLKGNLIGMPVIL